MNDLTDAPEETDETETVAIDDPIAMAILNMLAEDLTPTFQDAARLIADQRRTPKDGPNLWRRYLVAVRQQAVHLAKAGRIEITRKGEVADPKDFKGIVRMRLPK